MIALVLIATGGPRYTQYVNPLIESANKYFPEHETFVFTDNMDLVRDDRLLIPTPDLGWPRATLMRYHMINQNKSLFDKHSHIFYCDIDMLFVAPINPPEILTPGLTAVEHPGYPDAFCRDPKSTAYIPEWHNPMYYQGCFQGGGRDTFLQMSETIAGRIDEDDKNGVMAIWHDESHYNKYLFQDARPSKVLTPAYCMPEEKYLRNQARWLNQDTIIKIRHIEKTNQGDWKNK